MEFQRHTLNNGLEIVAEVNPRAYSSSYAFFVNTGARDETEVESGVSHFLEHMTFKGTPRRSADDVNRELDENLRKLVYVGITRAKRAARLYQ